MKRISHFFKGLFPMPFTFGADTDSSTVEGYQDVIIRNILSRIGTEALAAECDAIDLYCLNQMYLETLPGMKGELVRRLCNSEGDHGALVAGIRKEGFNVYGKRAPKGAFRVQGLDVPIFFVIRKRQKEACSIRLFFTDKDGKDGEYKMLPPREGSGLAPQCLVGRDDEAGRINDISLADRHVSRRQTTILWWEGAWTLLSECDHTWVGEVYAIRGKLMPLPPEGILKLDERGDNKIRFVQEPVGDAPSA